MDIKKVRVQFTYVCALLYFISFQVLEATETGEKATFFEALAVAVAVFGLLYIGFSDWFYRTQIIDQGLKLKNSIFQQIGLLTVVLFISIIIASACNGFDDGLFNIYRPGFYVLYGSIYLLAMLVGYIGNKKSDDI